MASSATCSPIFLLLTLLASLHVHARDSQFFSKVTGDSIPKQALPTKEQQPLNKPEQNPNFVQQNSGGYGLYGHESGQLPPTTTTTENLPYKTQTENTYNKENNPNLVNGLYYSNDANYLNEESYSNSNSEAYVTKQQGMSNNNYNNGDQYYNNDAYVTYMPQGMRNTRFTDNAYTTPLTNSNNNYNGDNREHGIGEAQSGVTNGNHYNNGKHGMSDTRVLENGRYYYDLKSEKNYNVNNNNNGNENSRGFDPRTENYNLNRGNYGNSFKGQYGNNENSYEANNFMEGYNGNQEEFQEFKDEQSMP